MKQHLLIASCVLVSAMTLSAENRPPTFHEGFEGRGTDGYVQNTDSYANNYLPEGWTEKSLATPPHNNYPDVGNSWDYTWVTLPTNSIFGSAHSGDCYAHIRNVLGYDPEESDEWLISPQINVQTDDILHFYVSYCPWFTLRPDNTTHEPSGKYNYLEVLISEDDGQTWSESLWDSYEDAKKLPWDEIYNSSMSSDWRFNYKTVFVNLDKYFNKTIKIAFRYRGRLGSDISIDDVTVGVPYPEASYLLPEGYLMPAMTSSCAVPVAPMAFSAPGVADIWDNTSLLCNAYSWTYTDGADAVQTSEEANLTTPAYADGTIVPFPVLDGRYGQNHSGDWSYIGNVSAYGKQIGLTDAMIQYGGELAGKKTDTEGTESFIGVANYNLYDPGFATLAFNDMVALSAEAERRWDARFTNGAVRDWDFLQAIGSVYPAPTAPYGISYVYANALIEKVHADTKLKATVCKWETETLAGVERSYVGDPIATATATIDPASVGSGMPACLFFDFSKNPVTVDSPYVILVSDYTRDYDDYDELAIADDIRFYYVSSTTPQTAKKSIILFKDYNSQLEGGWYNTFFDLSEGSLDSTHPDRHPAGLLFGLGVATSKTEMVSEDNTMECPAEGGEKTFTIKTTVPAQRLALVDGDLPCDWAEMTAVANGDNVDVTIKVSENTGSKRRNKTLRVAAPGSYAEINVKQDRHSGLETIGADADAPVVYYNLQGVRVNNPSNGVYIRRQGNKAAKVYVK